MKVQQLLVLAASAAVLLVVADRAGAQVGFYNTFTSGNPPIGDGNDYPRDLNPARQVAGGGAGADSFGTFTGVAFTNLNGNPAYFDSNNLLTRPANLIDGDAFWTDPKLGNFVGTNGDPFTTALVAFDFFDSSIRSFGFDLAVASGSDPVPDSIPFSVQDFNDDDFGFGELVLDPSFGGDFESITPTDAGTFATLGGRVAREARYRIDVSDLEGLISSQTGENPEEPTGDGRLGEFWIFDIDLRGIATFGGTTQIAIDNFVINGAQLPGPGRSPTYLPPTPPVGENRPQYFNYASATNDQSDGDSYDFDPETFGDGFANITVLGDVAAEEGVGARAETAGTSITFESDSAGLEILRHEVTHAVQQELESMERDDAPLVLPPDLVPPAEPPPFELRSSLALASAAIEADAPLLLGTGVRVTNIVNHGSGTPGPGASPSLQVVEVLTQLGSGPDDALARLAAEQQLDERAIEEAVAGGARFTNAVLDESPQMVTIAMATSADPMFYLGYTADQYLALKDQSGEALVFGDAGSYILPVTGDSGQTVSYTVATWTVADVSGLYVPVLLNSSAVVPEPAGVALVGFVVMAIGARRRA